MNDPKIYLQILTGVTILSFGFLIFYFVFKIIKELALKSMVSKASEAKVSPIIFAETGQPFVEQDEKVIVINDVGNILRQSSEILLNIYTMTGQSRSRTSKSESETSK